ncbi:MAG: hypothetical protein Q7J10_04070 [Methanosarcinaceae archaeon]|nr:hypothetical protein [Methanosarcinaceae archaeon]
MTLLRESWKSFKRLIKLGNAEHHDVSEDTNETASQDKNVRKDFISPLIRKKAEKAHIQVGLDFGTSSTKMIYSQIGRRQFRVINFNHDLPNYPQYCLPSLAAINNSGNLLLGIPAARQLLDQEWDSGLNRFKVIVAGKYDNKFRESITENKFYEYLKSHDYDKSFTPERITAIYLAYAMNEARRIIEGYPEYKDVELDISFNVCIPIDHIENNEVQPVFEKIFSHAEMIEKEWRQKSPGFDPIKASYDLENKPTIADRDKRVFAVPEAVASIQSYLVSLRKQEGLHAVIDLGAGTTDVSIFNLFMPAGDSVSYWYAARNIPKGTINIERVIASYLTDLNCSSPCTCSDLFTCLSNLRDSSKENNTIIPAVFNEIRAIKKSDEYYQTWGSAYLYHLKKSSAWNNVEVFVCGGGSNLPYIEEVFSVPWWNSLKEFRYNVSPLPTPFNYETEGINAPFERMAVAYGLAHPLPEFGGYVLPQEAPDDTPPIIRRPPPDHEDLYT